ncbi:MAG: hypothetical protein HKN68_05530 [Saprospiraceae bacterium]|nr:hypothetical protein [Saprospiraceae bacterium]
MILVDDVIKTKCPILSLWIIKGSIDNSRKDSTSHLIDELSDNKEFHDSRIEPIIHARSAYKALGKEPSRYRPSAEALRRRLKSGKSLYKISPAVDIINIISIESGISIGGYDFENVNPPISLRSGGNEPYEAVGRGLLNIAQLPCLYDTIGPFGSPTSDSVRTMIKDETSEFLMVFYDFGSYSLTEKFVNRAGELLEKYCIFSPEHIGLL